MSTGSINGLSGSYLQSIVGNALQNAGPNATKTTNTAAISQGSDSGQLSPLAQLMNTLQQLQQTDPTKYQQVTQQIATNLQSAAKAAQASGNTAAATQLNQLATDFATASKSGQLPSIQDLAHAIGGPHRHHHPHIDSAVADSDSSATTTSSTNTTQTQSNTLDPLNIIQTTLASAGVTTSSS